MDADEVAGAEGRGGEVLIAEEVTGHSSLVTCGRVPKVEGPASDKGQVTSDAGVRVGYCIAADRYMKREDCGIIYQMNVAAGAAARADRGDAAAGAVRAVGVRVPAVLLLVRAGHRGEPVLGIAGVRAAGVPGGVAREGARAHLLAAADPRGRCDDAVLVPFADDGRLDPRGPAGLPDPAGGALAGREADRAARRTRWRRRRAQAVAESEPSPTGEAGQAGQRPVRRPVVRPARSPGPEPKPKREPKPKVKNDPRLVAAARELRDRYLEHVNSGQLELESCRQVRHRLPATARRPKEVPTPDEPPGGVGRCRVFHASTRTTTKVVSSVWRTGSMKERTSPRRRSRIWQAV